MIDLPVCSRPAFAVSGSSSEIDRLVKERLRGALSLYELDVPLIRELRPTHILTQTQCKVCAVSLEDVERAARRDFGCEAAVISLEPYALADLWRDIERVAGRCDVPAAGAALITRLQGAMSAVAARAETAKTRPRVAAIEWIDPLMAAGNWVPELIEMASAENLFGVAGAHSPWMSWEELQAADPDILVALPCGFDLTRTRQEMQSFTARPGWHEFTAVRSGKVFLCDGNQFMNRPGPRLVESLRIFGEICHPELFAPELEGAGWQKM